MSQLISFPGPLAATPASGCLRTRQAPTTYRNLKATVKARMLLHGYHSQRFSPAGKESGASLR